MPSILEIKSGLSTKQFTLDISKGTYYLSVCAYGEFFSETFELMEQLEDYLKNNWNFSDKQTQELISKAITQ